MLRRSGWIALGVGVIVSYAATLSTAAAAADASRPSDQVFSIPLQLDTGGQPLDAGICRYTLTFAPHSLPPASMSWSLTMYELPQQQLVKNPLGRHAIGSWMLGSLVRSVDGSITVYIQNYPPGDKQDANWLPAPDGPFMMVLRLDGPEPAALDGAWEAPPVERVE